MSQEGETDHDHGRVSFEPTGAVVAGTFATWTLAYEVGALGMDDGSTLRVAFSQTSDWGTPQFADPAADNYATVETDGEATVTGSYESKAHVRPFKTVVQVDVSEGSLSPGDTVTLTLGDASGGSLGHRVQTFPEREFELRVLVDPVRTGEFVHVETITVDVVAGAARSLVAVAPSTVAPGEEATLRVRAEDHWGSRARDYDATLVVDAPEGVEVPVELAVEEGVGEATFAAGEGVHRLAVRDADRGFAATANPTIADEAHEDDRTYWGDVHGQSGETVGTGTVREYFAYARDSAFVDFAAHAGNDFQITEELWDAIQRTVREFHDPGEFVTFPCYEWSANTPVGGDHNVYFRDDGDHEIHRSHRWLVTDDDAERPRGTNTAEALYERFAGRDDVLIVPHQGGRPATLDAFDSDLTPFVEIASVWGVFEWFGQEALDRGYEVGFVAGTDDHSGRPGATSPDQLSKHNLAGGLMAARTDALTREGLWDAFTGRRVYATTGARILLDARVDGAPMGAETTAVPEVDVTVNGTAGVQEVDLFRGGERVASERFDDGDPRVEVRWRGAKGTGRDKVVDWSGGLALDEGAIRAVEEVGIDRPTDGVTVHEPTAVRWTATTTGNHQALRLTLDAPEDAILAVRTGPARLEATLADLADGPASADPGLLDTALELRRVSADAPPDVVTALADPDPPAGTHPYYVRVRQTDGELAWSSPTFVTVE